ncbi:MAG: C25 family cysteine peptidase [candidate division WOR-3 bacterium]
MNKKILFMVLLFSVISIYSEKLEINFQKENDLKKVSILKVMENNFNVNLPSYFIILKDNLSKIQSVEFENPFEVKDYRLIGFSQQPLSLRRVEQEKLFKGELKEYFEYSPVKNSVKIFPYFIKDGKIFSYEKAIISYSKILSIEKKENSLYDYLIITSIKYDSIFSRLKDWKTKKGYKTKLSFIESILPYYSGVDSAEKIRNYIKNEYNVNRFKYLLLGGDRAIIPVRRLYAMNCNADYYPDEDSIPSDLYYSNLDGNFNFDGDDVWGEVEDSSDLIPEVVAGRILFDTIYYGPSPIISRIIDYDRVKNNEHLSRGVFLGMVLWDDPMTSGGVAKDMIDNDIIPEDFHLLKFYEDLGHLGKADILDSLDMGYNIVNHNGHGSFKGVWVDYKTAITRGDATTLTNGSKTGLFYSIGCWVGAYDREDTTYILHSITENFQDSPTGGFISIITNSRYGWGAPGYPGYGVSEILDYRFFQILFQESEYKRPSEILNQVKSEIEPFSYDENLYRWHIYQLNYFGDPELPIFTQNPENLNVVFRKNTDFLEVFVRDQNNNPVSNVLICFSKDTILRRGNTDGNGYISFSTTGINDSDYIYFVASKVNYKTVYDSLILKNTGTKNISIFSDSLFSGANNYLKIKNSDLTPHNVKLVSKFLNDEFVLESGSTDSIIYVPLSSNEIIDTLYLYLDNVLEDTVFLKVYRLKFSIENLYFSNSNFNIKVKKEKSPRVENAKLRIVLNGSYTLLDTVFFENVDDILEKTFYCGVPAGENNLKFSFYIYKNDTLLAQKKDYLNNGEYSFYDDFTGDLSKWERYTSNWTITKNQNLHPGSETGYFNNMADTITSKEFYIYPQTLCSIYIYAKLPVLEFYNSQPIFNVDGIFINLLKNDTIKILDFISSGGALTKDSSLVVKGWKVYNPKIDSLEKVKLQFIFRSDSVITDSGVFISYVKVKPRFFYSETTGIIRNDTNVVYRDKLTYYFKGLKGVWKVKILSIDGRVVKNFTFENKNNFTFDLKNFSNGVYFVIFENEKILFKDKILLIK